MVGRTILSFLTTDPLFVPGNSWNFSGDVDLRWSECGGIFLIPGPDSVQKMGPMFIGQSFNRTLVRWPGAWALFLWKQKWWSRPRVLWCKDFPVALWILSPIVVFSRWVIWDAGCFFLLDFLGEWHQTLSMVHVYTYLQLYTYHLHDFWPRFFLFAPAKPWKAPSKRHGTTSFLASSSHPGHVWFSSQQWGLPGSEGKWFSGATRFDSCGGIQRKLAQNHQPKIHVAE